MGDQSIRMADKDSDYEYPQWSRESDPGTPIPPPLDPVYPVEWAPEMSVAKVVNAAGEPIGMVNSDNSALRFSWDLRDGGALPRPTFAEEMARVQTCDPATALALGRAVADGIARGLRSPKDWRRQMGRLLTRWNQTYLVIQDVGAWMRAQGQATARVSAFHATLHLPGYRPAGSLSARWVRRKGRR